MTSWIVTIREGLGHHWDRAEQFGVWDLGPNGNRKIGRGDPVYFWLSGEGFVGRAEVTSELVPHSADDGPWDDRGQGRYFFRFGLRALPSPQIREVKWKRDVKSNTSIRAELNAAPLKVDSDADERWLAGLFDAPAVDHFWTNLAADYELPAEPEGLDIDEDRDERRRVEVSIALRRGQPRFRRDLLQAYEGTCAVSGSQVDTVLEAAHIAPYRGDHTHDVRNGLLLRSDIHTLFDSFRLTVTPGLEVAVAPDLRGSSYGQFHFRTLSFVPDVSQRPDAAMLMRHNAKCNWMALSI